MKIHTLEDIIRKAARCLDDAKECMFVMSHDFIIDRSYLAMYHGVQALLFTRNTATMPFTEAYIVFHQEFILTQLIAKEHGLALKRSFEKRQFSDYDYDEVSQEDAKESLDDARDFAEAVIQYLKENNHLQ
ncbi:HEPN domain-containing protein [Dyadobacter sediminis]|uniref:HEPN domain-containing protein n=1 Tax=Dyadobacter sediminis TaxID=1493691 RepID=A0A5R9KDR1_9BACT|nr:HEPN domain-containing protein [Dyadobacter sediminis]TLU94171.1 HEPN domain-containing protein [Dyadobacter sediminis]GGB93609.1 UPF0332 protein [Dyadobacter sediminis]